MTTILKKIQWNRIFAFIISLILSCSILFTLKPAYSSDGSVLDPIITSAQNYIENFVDIAGNAFVNEITGSLSPSFDLYYKLSNPEYYKATSIFSIDSSDPGLPTTSAKWRLNPIIDYIFTYSQTLGYILSSILTLFFLILCMCGRAEQIRDTPLQIFGKFIVYIIFLYFSWDIIYYTISAMDNVWTNLIMHTHVEDVDATLLFKDFCINLVATTSKSGITPFLKIPAELVLTIIDQAFFSFLSIFFVWKLFKSFLRLWIEIVERYFVLTMLLLFSPVAASTFISNSTSNILNSYIRMIFSQGFLLITNGAFMKIFVFILMHGGWTAGITNYICAMAYMKFCMKVDSYMNSMGINVAQTGGGLMDSVGGSFNTITNALRSFGMADRAVSNYGRSLMAKGAANNDKNTYDRGVKYSGGITRTPFQTTRGTSSNSQFSKAVANAPTAVETRTGSVYRTGGTAEGLNNIANKINIASTSLQKTLNQSGINATDVHSVKQLNGSKQFSHTAGTRFALIDENGNNLAVIDGTNSYHYKNRNSDLKTYNENQTDNIYENYANNDDFKNAGIDVKVDENSNGIIRKASEEDTFGKQLYNVPTSKGTSELWEATMVAEHPEVLDDKKAILTYNQQGDAISLRRVSKQSYNENEE